jgi:predicted phosphodiesterase
VRALVISDVHGNSPALAAVLAEPHDVLICLGDVVGYGPEPGACVRRVRATAELLLRGNHDHALATGAPPGCRPDFRWLADATAMLGLAQLSAAERTALSSLPAYAYHNLNGGRHLFVHATPGDPLYRYLGADSAAWAEEVKQVEADVVFVGHTHVQFRLEAGGRTILNPGSVGQPKDGDPRAAYALIEEGTIHLRRVAYPVERTVTALERSGVDPRAVTALADLLRSGRASPVPGHGVSAIDPST